MSAPAPAPPIPPRRHARDSRSQEQRQRLLHLWDKTFWWLTGAGGTAFLLLLGALAVFLLSGALPALELNGPAFVTGSSWSPDTSTFGALPAIEGTLVTSALALALAVPVALGVAIFLTDVAPRRLRGPLAYLLDLAAAVPSVVYGIWAFFVLRPALAGTVEPGLRGLTSGGFPFASGGLPNGQDLLSASLILAIMVLPTIGALSREALLAVPALSRESYLSLGATRWEATKMALRGPARPGIFAGIMLGFGRAVGETIAVLIMAGGVYQLDSSLLAPGVTLASWIANDFAAVLPTSSTASALYGLGFLLLALSVGVNVLARLLIRVLSRPRSSPARIGGHHPRARAPTPPSGTAGSVGPPPAPTWLRAARDAAPHRRRRRVFLQRGISTLALVAIALALAPMVGLVATAADLGGADVVTPSFYTSLPPIAPAPGQHGAMGGIGPAIVGTFVLLGIASLFAVPLGIFAAIFVHEHARHRVPRLITFLSEVMTGVPTLLIGLFAFALFFSVARSWAQGALIGGIALGFVMLPIVLRSSVAALAAVPASVREAGLALGFPRNRVALRVSLGTARSAIASGGLLGLARAAGDTAALLFTAGYATFYANGLNSPIASLPTFIFNNYASSAPNMQAAAWGAALVLLLLILGLNVFARIVTRTRTRPARGPTSP